jgi:hypothetical protein
MKKINLLIAAVMLLSITANAQSQNSLFQKYSDMKDVSSVYISKAMLEMQPEMNMNLPISNVSQKLDAVYIVSTTNSGIKGQLRKDLDQYLKSGKYEVLMKQKNATFGSSTFYMKKKGTIIKEVLVIIDEAASIEYIMLQGEIDIKALQQITNPGAYHRIGMSRLPGLFTTSPTGVIISRDNLELNPGKKYIIAQSSKKLKNLKVFPNKDPKELQKIKDLSKKVSQEQDKELDKETPPNTDKPLD